MPINQFRRVLRLFLASPSDVPLERAATERVLSEVNRTLGAAHGYVIEIVRWEDVTPGMGRPEQIILDSAEIGDCDLFVGILWNRFGTPTGRAESGTEEEFQLAFRSWQTFCKPHIMFYFCQQPANFQTEAELEQKRKVVRFHANLRDKGIVTEYGTPDNFEMHLRQHLTAYLLSNLKPSVGQDNSNNKAKDASRKHVKSHRRKLPNHGLVSVDRMVQVPSGEFFAGFPMALASLDYDFMIDETPVTNQQFATFLKDSDHIAYLLRNLSPTGAQIYEAIIDRAASIPDHPVVGVTWFDAVTFATWCGKRLPSSIEWEKAARGKDGRVFPWGNEFDPLCCNCEESRIGTTTPVKRYPNGRSQYGCFDMAGNVFEWVGDWALRPRFSNLPNSEKVNRNGSFNRPAAHMVCWYTESDPPDMRMNDVGFRCVFVSTEQQRRR